MARWMLGWLARLASARGFPARDDGLYLQSIPHARHREHIGLDLLHFTLAEKQPSQEALSLCSRGFEEDWFEDIVPAYCMSRF